MAHSGRGRAGSSSSAREAPDAIRLTRGFARFGRAKETRFFLGGELFVRGPKCCEEVGRSCFPAVCFLRDPDLSLRVVLVIPFESVHQMYGCEF